MMWKIIITFDPRYGTMEDLEELSREAGKRGISLMLDMVFNHTSDRHEWFRKALAGDPEYKDFYISKKGKSPEFRLPTGRANLAGARGNM